MILALAAIVIGIVTPHSASTLNTRSRIIAAVNAANSYAQQYTLTVTFTPNSTDTDTVVTYLVPPSLPGQDNVNGAMTTMHTTDLGDYVTINGAATATIEFDLSGAAISMNGTTPPATITLASAQTSVIVNMSPFSVQAGQ
jgi:hypothetical protein